MCSFLTACAAPTPASVLPLSPSTIASPTATMLSRPTVVVIDPFIVAAQFLANGEFNLLAASAPGEAGFHEPFGVTHTIPSKLEPSKGKRLIIALRDLSRPQQKCENDDPRSGCATVDWSDDPNRAKVPRGGLFENSITLQLVSGSHTFYLGASGALSDQPDKLDSSHRQSAVGGDSREWSVILADDLLPGRALKLNLVMTKLGAPNVRMGYDIRVQPTR